MEERNPNWKSSWRVRRRFMFAVAAFCMWTVAYVLYKDLQSGPADTAVTMSFLTLLGIVGSYVFGATWEDVSKAKLLGASRRGATASPYYDSGAYSPVEPGTRPPQPAPGPGASATMEDIP